MAERYIVARLNAIESEVAEVRRRIEESEHPRKRTKSLFGILGRVDFTESEIDRVVGSMFRTFDAEE